MLESERLIFIVLFHKFLDLDEVCHISPRRHLQTLMRLLSLRLGTKDYSAFSSISKDPADAADPDNKTDETREGVIKWSDEGFLNSLHFLLGIVNRSFCVAIVSYVQSILVLLRPNCELLQCARSLD